MNLYGIQKCYLKLKGIFVVTIIFLVICTSYLTLSQLQIYPFVLYNSRAGTVRTIFSSPLSHVASCEIQLIKDIRERLESRGKHCGFVSHPNSISSFQFNFFLILLEPVSLCLPKGTRRSQVSPPSWRSELQIRKVIHLRS